MRALQLVGTYTIMLVSPSVMAPIIIVAALVLWYSGSMLLENQIKTVCLYNANMT